MQKRVSSHQITRCLVGHQIIQTFLGCPNHTRTKMTIPDTVEKHCHQRLIGCISIWCVCSIRDLSVMPCGSKNTYPVKCGAQHTSQNNVPCDSATKDRHDSVAVLDKMSSHTITPIFACTHLHPAKQKGSIACSDKNDNNHNPAAVMQKRVSSHQITRCLVGHQVIQTFWVAQPTPKPR